MQASPMHEPRARTHNSVADPAPVSMAERNRAPSVSVVMPVFNGEPFLIDAVESTLRQSLQDIELVAVDDGSRDGSRAVLERYSRADARIKLIASATNVGIAAALNLGLRAARSDYVAIASADDLMFSERLVRESAFLDSHPKVAAVGSAVVTISESGSRGPVFRFPTDARVIRSTLLRHNCMAHPSVMLRRSAVAAVGGYRFDYIEDYDLWLRLSERYDLANLAEPLVLYRLHPGQLSLTRLEDVQRLRLTVRAAAWARCSGEADPLAEVGELTLETSTSIGVDEHEIARAVRAEWLSRAAILSELNATGAKALAAEASRALGGRAPSQIRAARELLRAEARLAARRPLAMMFHVARAFCHEPIYATARLSSWIADRLRPWRYSGPR